MDSDNTNVHLDNGGTPLYTNDQAQQIANTAAMQAVGLFALMQGMNLENGILQTGMEASEGKDADMSKRKKQRVNVNGVTRWFTGTQQEIIFNAAMAMLESGMLGEPKPQKQRQAPLFGEYARKWFELYKNPGIEESTANAYGAQLRNHIYPFFDKMRLDEISTDDIQRFFVIKADMSASYTRQMRGLLRQVFEAAIEDKLITDNPENSKRITMPKKVTERQPMELEDAQRVLDQIPKLTKEQRLLLAILMYTGIRRGEMLALQWEDIDFKRKIIHVWRQVVYGNGNQPKLKPPKSDAGKRDIPLTPDLEAVIAPYMDSGFILHMERDKGKPLTLQLYRKLWKSVNEAVNMHGATPHCLRHTFTTMGVERTDPKTLQAIMGHSSIDITLNRYAHARKDKVEKAAHEFAGMYGNVTHDVTDTKSAQALYRNEYTAIQASGM